MNDTAQLVRDYSRELGYTINEFLASGHAVASWKLWWRSIAMIRCRQSTRHGSISGMRWPRAGSI